MQNEIYLTIEGEPQREVQVWYRGSGAAVDSEENGSDNPAPIIFTGKLGADGRVTVRVPRAYLCIGSPERRDCVPLRLNEESGNTASVRLDFGQVRGGDSIDSRDNENAEDEAVKQPLDHDFIAQMEDDAVTEQTDDRATTRAALRPWRVAKSLLKLRDQVNLMAPSRSKASDGTIGDAAHRTRNSDHNPWINNGAYDVVSAMDITQDAAHGCDANAIAEAIRASRDGRVKYIIWNRQICSSSSINGAAAWSWRQYGGSNGHTHHVHISVKSDPGNYDSANDWNI